jgi:hypothetical protein
MRGGQDASHVRATRLSTVAVVMAGLGHSPLKAMFAPLVPAFDALLGTVSGDIGWRLLVTPWCLLPASLCRAKHGHLIAGGVLGSGVVQLLKRAPEEVIMFTLPWALRAAFG